MHVYMHVKTCTFTCMFYMHVYLKGQNDRINIEKDELDEYKWLSLEEMRKNPHIWCRIIELFEKVEDNLRDIQRII
jgi:hypothetical protein